MTNKKKQIRGIDWAAIFKERPELEPPGYYETIANLYPPEEEKNDDP